LVTGGIEYFCAKHRLSNNYADVQLPMVTAPPTMPATSDQRSAVVHSDPPSASWRRHLDVHPAADLFPAMADSELEALGKDIATHGLQTPIILWPAADDDEPHEALLDGRNRLDAATRAGLLKIDDAGNLRIKHPSGHYVDVPRTYLREEDPYAVVVSQNIHRRHLSPDQRRVLIGQLLKSGPQQSNRQIAKQTRADDKTVANVRKGLEATAEIPQLRERVGADLKARPAQRSKPKPGPQPRLQIRRDLIDQAMTLIQQMREIDYATWEQLDRLYLKAREKLSEIAF
jgi:hypothetical protein